MDEQIKLTIDKHINKLKQRKKDIIELASLYDSRLILNALDKEVCSLLEEIENLEYTYGRTN